MSKQLSRRGFLRIGAGSIGAAALAACAVPTTVEVEVTAVPVRPEIVQLEYAGVHAPSGLVGELKRDLIVQFNEENPDLRLEYTWGAARTAGTLASEALMADIAAGIPPDLVDFEPASVPLWAENGALIDLTDRMSAADLTTGLFYKAVNDQNLWKGKWYAFLYSMDGRVLYYRKDLFREAGLDPDSPPTHIDEIATAAEALTSKTGERYESIGFIPWAFQGRWIYTWGFSWGAQFMNPDTLELTVNHPQVVALWEWMRDWRDQYGGINVITSFTEAFGAQAQDPFIMGVVPMMINGNWMISNFRKYAPDMDYGASWIPYPREGGQEATWTSGWSWAIPRGVDYLDDSFRALNWLAQRDNIEAYNLGRSNFSPYIEHGESPAFRENPAMSFFVDTLPFAGIMPPTPMSDMAWAGLSDAFDDIMHDKVDVQEALDDLNARLNEELQQYL